MTFCHQRQLIFNPGNERKWSQLNQMRKVFFLWRLLQIGKRVQLRMFAKRWGFDWKSMNTSYQRAASFKGGLGEEKEYEGLRPERTKALVEGVVWRKATSDPSTSHYLVLNRFLSPFYKDPYTTALARKGSTFVSTQFVFYQFQGFIQNDNKVQG